MNLLAILAWCRQLATNLLALGGTISISPLKINTALYTWVINLVFHTLVYNAIQVSRKPRYIYREWLSDISTLYEIRRVLTVEKRGLLVWLFTKESLNLLINSLSAWYDLLMSLLFPHYLSWSHAIVLEVVHLIILSSFCLQTDRNSAWENTRKMKVVLVAFMLFAASMTSCLAFDCPRQCTCGDTIRCRVKDLTILKKILPANITRL